METKNLLGEMPSRDETRWIPRNFKYKPDIIRALNKYRIDYDKKNLSESLDTILRNALLADLTITEHEISNGELTIKKPL